MKNPVCSDFVTERLAIKKGAPLSAPFLPLTFTSPYINTPCTTD
jgi:hypothetical protein